MREKIKEIMEELARELDSSNCKDPLSRIIDMFVIDPLLCIPNRLYFDLFLNRELSIASRYGLPMGVIFLDADGLKYINDTYGHLAGDTYLKAIVENVQATLRTSDLIIRWGGDEFVILLHADVEGLFVAKERLKKKFEGTKIDLGGETVPLSVSMGYAGVRDGDIIGAIKEADKRMYEEKRRKYNGANRTHQKEKAHNCRGL